MSSDDPDFGQHSQHKQFNQEVKNEEENLLNLEEGGEEKKEGQ